MTGKEIYKIWAPPDARWTAWVRPVPFVGIGVVSHGKNAPVSFGGNAPVSFGGSGSAAMTHREVQESYFDAGHVILHGNELKTDTAIILDLPGNEAIKEAISLARRGFRPIPLYNGTRAQPGAMALVDNHGLEQALLWGALELSKIKLEKEAPPVFLLDSNRMHRFRMSASVFDNSWDLYQQDLPSAAFFVQSGINKIIIKGEKVQRDLAEILYRFPAEGVALFHTDGDESPRKVRTIHTKIMAASIFRGISLITDIS